MEDFLEALEARRNVTKAARAAGVGRKTVYRHRDSNPEFAKLWDAALEMARRRRLEVGEDALIKRAVFGWLEPVYHQGVLCGYKRKFSDFCLGKLLAAEDPDRYAHVLAKEVREDRLRRESGPAPPGRLEVTVDRGPDDEDE